MEEKKKDQAAVSLGRRGARARWAKLSPEERAAAGRKLTDARLARRARATIAAQDTDEPEATP